MHHRKNNLFLLAALICSYGVAHAGALTSAETRMMDNDQELRTMPCHVSVVRPHLEVDLRFHTGYIVTINAGSLGENGTPLQMVTRITPHDQPQHTFLIRDSAEVPQLPAAAKTDLETKGRFTIGPGRYRLDFLLYDAGGNACSSHDDVEAAIPSQLKSVPFGLPANTAGYEPDDPFFQPSAELGKSPHPLSVKVLVSFSTGNPARASVQPDDVRAVTSILRLLAREPRFGNYSVTLFSVEEKRVLYQTRFQPHIDFAALKKAARDLRLGTVDYRQLQDPASTRKFLSRLFVENLGAESERADAVVIVSPRLMIDEKIPRETLEAAGRMQCPVFYLNYTSDPLANPWSDPIGTAVKIYHGLQYSITAPKDMGTAYGDMMARLMPR